MPPLPNVPNVMKFRTLGDSTAGINWNIVTHYTYSGSPPSVPALTAFATTANTAWTADLTPLQHDDLSLTGHAIVDLSSETGAEATVEAAVPGTLTGAPLPAGAAMLVSYSINRRYRGGHPRQYLPVGDSTSTLNTSQWVSTFATSVFNAFRNYGNAIIGQVYGSTTITGRVAVSYYSGHVLRATPVVLALELSGTSETIASQRRRTRRRS